LLKKSVLMTPWAEEGGSTAPPGTSSCLSLRESQSLAHSTDPTTYGIKLQHRLQTCLGKPSCSMPKAGERKVLHEQPIQV
jgi:hypothetical protein